MYTACKTQTSTKVAPLADRVVVNRHLKPRLHSPCVVSQELDRGLRGRLFDIDSGEEFLIVGVIGNQLTILMGRHETDDATLET